MKILVINGTEQTGCTFHLKECFLQPLCEGNEITEFYLPKDLPHFCTGCKTCFMQSADKCPHAAQTMRIWNEVLTADLLVFAFPVYVSGIPAQLKALLDHFACHHMVHQPDKRLFTKRALILSQSKQSSNRVAQKEVKSSLVWLGVPEIEMIGFALKDSYTWDDLPQKRREEFEKKLHNLAQKYHTEKPAKQSVKVKMLYAISRAMIRKSERATDTPSADAVYWHSQGWI